MELTDIQSIALYIGNHQSKIFRILSDKKSPIMLHERLDEGYLFTSKNGTLDRLIFDRLTRGQTRNLIYTTVNKQLEFKPTTTLNYRSLMDENNEDKSLLTPEKLIEFTNIEAWLNQRLIPTYLTTFNEDFKEHLVSGYNPKTNKIIHDPELTELFNHSLHQ